MTTTTATGHPFGRSYTGSAPENYERYFVPVLGRPHAADLVKQAGLRAGERVLDVACGTGIVARLAAERVGPTGSVAALDLNAGMLEVARSVTRSASTPIKWYETTMEAIPLEDGSFDAVLCQLGLQFVTDKAAAAREMTRVVAPGGRILVSVPTPTRFFDVFEHALARHVPAAAPFVRMVFSLDDAAKLERLFRDAGLRDVVVRRETKQIRLPAAREFLWQYVHCTPLTALLADADPDLLGAIERDVVSGWEPWSRDGGLTYEQGMLVLTARK
jgi:ubiquinone/menaquinone biosynthesis C-methylase UbiE